MGPGHEKCALDTNLFFLCGLLPNDPQPSTGHLTFFALWLSTYFTPKTVWTNKHVALQAAWTHFLFFFCPDRLKVSCHIAQRAACIPLPSQIFHSVFGVQCRGQHLVFALFLSAFLLLPGQRFKDMWYLRWRNCVWILLISFHCPSNCEQHQCCSRRFHVKHRQVERGKPR